MKVAFISHYAALYGANRSLLNLIEGLKKYDVEPYIIIPERGEIIDRLQEIEVEFAVIPFEWWIGCGLSKNNGLKLIYQIPRYLCHAVIRLLKNILSLLSFTQQLKAWDIDIIYSNSSVIPIGAFAAKKLGLPHVWHLREFIDLDYNFHLDWGRSVFNYFLNRTEFKIAISQAIHSYFIPESSYESSAIVYNGVASQDLFDRYRQQKKGLSNCDQNYTFVLVGVIHPNKGQQIAIEALSLLTKDFPQIRLLIVGGEEKAIPTLKELTQQLNVADKVEFWGYISDPYEAYMQADAALMCSVNEGMGRVTVEAMSACCPVIGYDNGGTSEIICHEHTGLLYTGQSQALAACMKRFLENPQWAKQLGENAWKEARDKYSIESYAKEIYRILTITHKPNFDTEYIEKQAYSKV